MIKDGKKDEKGRVLRQKHTKEAGDTSTERFFSKVTANEYPILCSIYKPFFDGKRLCNEFCGNKKGWIYFWNNIPCHYRSYLKRELAERVLNIMMIVPKFEKPHTQEEYIDVIDLLTQYVLVKDFCDYYGFDYNKLRKFQSKQISLTKEYKKELDLIIKALQLRPLNYFDAITYKK